MNITTESVGPVSSLDNSTFTMTTPGATQTESEAMGELRSFITNSAVIPTMRNLLSRVLMTVNAAIPNKDQNRAVTNLIRDHFDNSYFLILRLIYPDVTFQSAAGVFAIDPEPEKVGFPRP